MTFDHYKIELLQPEDGVAFFNLVDGNRARLEDFFAGTVSKTKTLQDTITYCETIQKRIAEQSYFPFMITDINTKKFVGLLDVKNIDWNVPKAELGSFIDANYESQGIVTKASGIMVDHLVKTYGFIKLLCRANILGIKGA